MLHYKYTESQITAIMNFTGFTRLESIDYFNALAENDNNMIIRMEQESKLLDQLIKSSNSKLINN